METYSTPGTSNISNKEKTNSMKNQKEIGKTKISADYLTKKTSEIVKKKPWLKWLLIVVGVIIVFLILRGIFK